MNHPYFYMELDPDLKALIKKDLLGNMAARMIGILMVWRGISYVIP